MATVFNLVIRKLFRAKLWHFVWISVLLAELATSAMSILLNGRITRAFLITGGIVSMLVSFIVFFLFNRLRETERALAAEAVRSKEALRESEERFKALFNQASDCFFLLDRDGAIVDANEATFAMHGYSREELIGKPISMLDDPETAGKVKERVRRIFSGEHLTFEAVHVRKDGTTFPVEVSTKLVYIGGKPFIQAIDRDITERRKMMDMLIQSMQDWEDSFNTITDMITVHDKDFNIIKANKAAEKILGLPFLYDIKAKCYRFYHGTDTPPDGCPSCRTYKTGEAAAVEMFEPHLNMHIEVRAIPRLDGDNRLVGLIHVVRDITDRKRAEKLIEDSLREKEVLLKEIHHRVKNNLQVISSLLSLQSDFLRDKGLFNALMDSQNRIKSMALIHEKLYQSRDLGRIDFAEYVRSLAIKLFSSYGADAVTLRIDAGDVMFGVDTAIPCGLIINELVSNSLKHAFPNGNKGEITVELSKNGGEIALSVGDNGVGFPDGLDFRNTESLGLQLVVTLVGQIGGTIELVNKAGTAFIVRFGAPERS